MPHRRPLVLALFALTLASLVAFVVLRLRTNESITSFIPSGDEKGHGALSRALAESELANTLILSVDGEDPRAVVEVARVLASRLRSHDEVAWVRSGVDAELERALYDVYFARRNAFVADSPEKLASLLEPSALRAHARAVKERLASPTGAMIARTVPADPMLAFAGLLDRLKELQAGTLTQEDGQFVTPDGKHAILFLSTKHSSFDATTQRAFLADVDALFEVARAGRGVGLRKSGVHPIAVHAEASIRSDMHRIAFFSTLGILLLYFGLFRSARHLALVLLPIAVAFVVALASTLAVFGSIHGLTLAFGSSLIGVCFDYPIYFLSFQQFAPNKSALALRSVWTSLFLGVATTVCGLSGLAWTSLPGLREIAVFSSVGVLSASLTTRYVLPLLVPDAKPASSFALRVVAAVERGLRIFDRRPALSFALLVCAVAFAAAFVPKLTWEDSAQAFLPSHPRIDAEDAAVLALVTTIDKGRFVLARGRTEEAALATNARIYEELSKLKEEGGLRAFRSLHALVWPAASQRASAEAMASPGAVSRVVEAFVAEGFVASAFSPFVAAAREPSLAPLTVDALRASSLVDLVRPFRVRVGGDTVLLSFVTGLSDPSVLEARLRAIPGAEFFDREEFMRSTYARYRVRTFELLAVGLPFMFGLLYLRYRDARRVLAAFVPALAGAGVALGSLALAGESANMMHLLGLLLVLTMGADYGIFFAESGSVADNAASSMLGVIIAAASALLSFGLLALSSHPALRGIGLTTGVGIAVTCVLVPATRRVFLGALS